MVLRSSLNILYFQLPVKIFFYDLLILQKACRYCPKLSLPLSDRKGEENNYSREELKEMIYSKKEPLIFPFRKQ